MIISFADNHFALANICRAVVLCCFFTPWISNHGAAQNQAEGFTIEHSDKRVRLEKLISRFTSEEKQFALSSLEEGQSSLIASIRLTAENISAGDVSFSKKHDELFALQGALNTSRELQHIIEFGSPPDKISDLVLQSIRRLSNPQYVWCNEQIWDVEVRRNWKAVLDGFHQEYKTLANSVGVIGYKNKGSEKIYYVGTAFAIDNNVFLTNKHMDLPFASRGDRAGNVESDFIVQVDFGRQYDKCNSKSVVIPVSNTVIFHEILDAAILIPTQKPSVPPIHLANNFQLYRDERIGVLGFPNWKSVQDRYDEHTLDLIFRLPNLERPNTVKRIAPGYLCAYVSHNYERDPDFVSKVLVHDASTVQGNSGSLIVDIDTGTAIGLHFAWNRTTEGGGDCEGLGIASAELRDWLSAIEQRVVDIKKHHGLAD